MYKQGAQYWTGSKESNQKFFEQLLLEASVCIANYKISITYIYKLLAITAILINSHKIYMAIESHFDHQW